MLLTVITILLAINLVISVFALLRKPRKDPADEEGIRLEIARNREESAVGSRHLREEVVSQITGLTRLNEQKLDSIRASLDKNLVSLAQTSDQKLERIRGSMELQLDNLRKTVEERLQFLQEENSKKLEQMRLTVDEKLHTTLEKRLGDSFKLVSDKLESVHKGLGEMQSLAAGVGDLKRVLTNVKTRGSWGEVQLGNLLDQILTPEQYSKNVATRKGSRDHVEFALKLPGKTDEMIFLPMDAKFPLEDYQRLLDAQDQANPQIVEEIGKTLEEKIKIQARNIKDKYLDPPHTTDFGVMFLPVEGLYAEVLRRPGLCDSLQREYRVVVMGPTTIAAFLNSLQMGFRTLAIEQRAGEVWNLLGAVKTEFGTFGELLDRTHKQLQATSNSIEGAARKTRTIERRLKEVQVLPRSETAGLLEDTPDQKDNSEFVE